MCKHHLNTVENTCKNHSHYLHAYTYSLCLKEKKRYSALWSLETFQCIIKDCCTNCSLDTEGLMSLTPVFTDALALWEVKILKAYY